MIFKCLKEYEEEV
jgi:hypothetical protein